MAEIKWIGTKDFKDNIEKLIANHDKVVIEFEFHTVLMKMLETLKELYPNYTTQLFEESNGFKWNYTDPNNLIMLKHEMFRNPNDRVYLEIDAKEQDYTCCYNSREWREALDNDKNNIAIATTLFYARDAYLESQRRKAQQCRN